MTPTLNPHQQEQFRLFLAKHEADEAISAEFDEKPNPVHELRWFPCDVPGTIAVVDENGWTMHLLLPAPRPVPRDPMFQKAHAVSNFWKPFSAIVSAPGWWRDWAWEGMTLDAPGTLPAGACEFFSLDDEVFGAAQMTCAREF